jgi:hypothetical protein
VIKFLRKGYRPFEVPINYCSRSYSEGKKVTIIRDPLLWIAANFKYKLKNPFKPMRQAYREARKEMSRGKARSSVNRVIDFSVTDDSSINAARLNENQSITAAKHTTVSEANT